MAAAAISASAVADDLNAARQMMSGGLASLALSSAATIQVDGWDTVGGVKIPLRVSTAVKFGGTAEVPRTYFEQLVFKNGLLTHRLAGDGVRLWSYDVAKMQYSSSLYDGVDDAMPNARQRLFTLATRWSPNEGDMSVRLFAQAFSVPGQIPNPNRWNPWISTANVSVVGETIDCSATSPTASRLVYYLSRPTFKWQLDEIRYISQRPTKNGMDETQWSARIWVDAVPPDASWQFLAPEGARPRAVVGGIGR